MNWNAESVGQLLALYNFYELFNISSTQKRRQLF